MMEFYDSESPDSLVDFQVPRLYKYVGMERLKKIIESLEIRLTQPAYLNDPHEVNAVINGVTLKHDLERHYLANGRTIEDAERMATRSVEIVAVDMVRSIEEQRSQLGVLSLTETADNMLMWAHYGDEHRGAVIEFDFEGLVLDTAIPNYFNATACVEYVESRIDLLGFKHQMWRTLCYKSSPWAYEREWRLIRALNCLRPKGNDVFVLNIPPSAIKRVIFGARARPDTEEPVYDAIQASGALAHVSIEKAWFGSSLTTLEISSMADFAGMVLHGNHHFGGNWKLVRQWVDLASLELAARPNASV